MENVIIIGSGPAGLTAAIYSARASLAPIVFEGAAPGGQLIVSNEVENFPGIPEIIHGAVLMQNIKQQAEKFGTRFKTEDVQKIEKKDGWFEITAPSGIVKTKTVIAATGATARRLNIPTEDKFYGRGVSGCATCDGAFFRDKNVIVVGGGNTAMEDAYFLTRFAKKVTIVHRRDYLRAAPAEVEKVKNHPKVKWLIPYVIQEILGENTVTGVILKNNITGEPMQIACDGIFVAIGHDPQTSLFEKLVELDNERFIITKNKTTKTKTPGLFAAGDVMDPVYKQAVTAAGAGCKAALDAQKYIEETL
ncbi:MAG: thioredoxin-disulfide reductase [Chlamydiae bacterium]|nr:MAG: thioredoxin-disulfide reductase [Chlamydiota bacterium]